MKPRGDGASPVRDQGDSLQESRMTTTTDDWQAVSDAMAYAPDDVRDAARLAYYRLRTTTPEPDAAVLWADPRDIADVIAQASWVAGAHTEVRQSKAGRFTLPLYATPQSAAPPAPVPAGEVDEPALPWREISQIPDCDDLFWFMRGDTIDGPRVTVSDDCDYWDWFAPCEAPSNTHPLPASAVDGREGGTSANAGGGFLIDEIGSALLAYRKAYEESSGLLFGGMSTSEYLAHQWGLAAALRTRTPGPAVVDENALELAAYAIAAADSNAYSFYHYRDLARAALTAALAEQRPSEQEKNHDL